MLYLVLKKNFKYKNSFIVLVLSSKRRILRKIGTFGYISTLNKFILYIDFIYLFFFFNHSYFGVKKFYKKLLSIVNQFKLI